MSVKITFILLKELYVELKKRAAEKSRSVKVLVVDAILQYLSAAEKRSAVLDLLLAPVEGAGPEDFREHEFEDVGG